MNPISEIGYVAKDVGVGIWHGVEDVIGVSEAVVKVLSDSKKLAPAFKDELAELVAIGEKLAATLAPVIATKGLDVALDIEDVAPVLSEVKELVASVVSFLPTLKAALATLESDVPKHFA